MKRVILTIALLAGAAAPAQALTIVDGDFADWSFNATGTATASVEAAGGNPGARINITTVSGATVHGTATKNDFTTPAALEGLAFTLSLDVLSGPGAFGEGQGISLLVEQGGSIYARSLGVTGFPRNFDTVEFNSSFQAASFGRLLGAGALNPDFSGGTATRFGFSGSNTTSGTLTQYYDNFSLEIPGVPEPASALLVALGAAAALGSVRRGRWQDRR